jgi:hypothetical protein
LLIAFHKSNGAHHVGAGAGASSLTSSISSTSISLLSIHLTNSLALMFIPLGHCRYGPRFCSDSVSVLIPSSSLSKARLDK